VNNAKNSGCQAVATGCKEKNKACRAEGSRENIKKQLLHNLSNPFTRHSDGFSSVVRKWFSETGQIHLALEIRRIQ
jgi:hypothetical protein